MDLSKTEAWRSKRYLAWVRDRPCAQCGKPGPSQAHHIIGLVGGHMGGKTGDQFAVPLCPFCHRELHEAHIELEVQLRWLARTQERAFHEGALTDGDPT